MPDCPKSALIATRHLSMHTTACASECNWSKRDLMFTKNRARLSIQWSSQDILQLCNYVFADFFEAELLDLSLEDDDYMHCPCAPDMHCEFGLPETIAAGQT